MFHLNGFPLVRFPSTHPIIPITAAGHGSFGGEKTCHWNARRGVAGCGRGKARGGGAIVANESKNFASWWGPDIKSLEHQFPVLLCKWFP